MTSPGPALAHGTGLPATMPPAEIHETHIGIVALVGDRAYKAKKPVVTDFLDFSTVERRQLACAREVELNRRLSPQAYLGVAQISDPEGGPSEPVIVMRRYRDADRLSQLVSGGHDVRDELGRIAEALARFHSEAARSSNIDASATVSATAARWRQNLAELSRLAGKVVPAQTLGSIDRLATEYLAGRAVLFSARIEARCIVDGHGDLLADDIFCTANGPMLLDCLEFDDSLRYVDVIDDVAFLAMDLEFLGRADLAEFFMARYQRAAGDNAPPTLADFYIAYRAVVRAKVDAIRFTQGDQDGGDRARRHLELALRRLRDGCVQMVMIGGGPGTGKTTLARALAQNIGGQVISTDEVRRELTASGVIGGQVGQYQTGLYSREQVAEVYEAVLHRAAQCLANGVSVILDGTWHDPAQRAHARDVARGAHCPSIEIVCALGLAEAQERVATRPAGNSDATPGIAAAMAGDTQAWPQAHRIDTNQPLADSVSEAQRLCRIASESTP